MKKTLMSLVALATFLGAHLAAAQGMGAPNFDSMDADSNGELSAEELAAAPPVQAGRVSAEQLMTNWDADSSGTVSEEEFDSRPQGMGMGG